MSTTEQYLAKAEEIESRATAMASQGHQLTPFEMMDIEQQRGHAEVLRQAAAIVERGAQNDDERGILEQAAAIAAEG